MKRVLIQAWAIYKVNGNYFLPYTHWIYLINISNLFDEVILLSPIKIYQSLDSHEFVNISDLKTIKVKELPYLGGYYKSVKNFFNYYVAYKELSKYNYTLVYARYPTPFGWLQKFFFNESKRVIHFVGDPIDVTKSNPNLKFIKKFLLTTFFLPEHYMYMWACKNAIVYTNGYHLRERLCKFGIKSKALISSTLTKSDFYFDSDKVINVNSPRLLYLGYLRRSKGVETIINAFKLLISVYPKSSLTIVGSGDFEDELKQLVKKDELFNITFLGHIDQRSKINKLLRSHDMFVFASLSEGSPRVILEAMANGLNVVSTPVGSLPYVFQNEEDIIFTKFGDSQNFFNRIKYFIEHPLKLNAIRKNAFLKVNSFTIEKFIESVFKV